MPLLESKADPSRIRTLVSRIRAWCHSFANGIFGNRDAQPQLPDKRIREVITNREIQLVEPSRQRLIEAKLALDRLEAERRLRGDVNFGKSLEERLVWRELVDLELQAADDEIRRICDGETQFGFSGNEPGKGDPQ